MRVTSNVLTVAALLPAALAVSCSLKSGAQIATADGWQAQLIADDLTAPRSIMFDTAGNLLVVQQGAGIVHITFDDGGGTCLEVGMKTFLVNATELNHGLALSIDGKILYASSASSVFAYTYDAAAVTVSSNTTIITGLANDDHTTRTLLLSQHQPGILVVSRGSNENIDITAEVLSSGHSQIKAFNVSALMEGETFDFATTGRLLGWGLRNSVGVAEEPTTGGIYSVENSADSVVREGVDVHEDNPGEELNFHGYLNSSTESQGGNYGYPYCFAVWNTSIPDLGTMTTGSQFVLENNSTINDTFCNTERIPPRLTFGAHMAPLDLKFLENETDAFISFHGSWDRTDPAGYKVSTISFSGGSPTAPPSSMTALTDIFYNVNNTKCPGSCFRPVGLAFDSRDRLFVSSDSSGEIFVLMKTEAKSGATTTSMGGSSPTGSPSPSATKSVGNSMKMIMRGWGKVVVGLAAIGFAGLML